MKKIFNDTLVKYGVLLLIFGVTSCSELDLLPESQVPSDNFYTTDAEIETVAAAVYGGLQACYSRESGTGGLWSVTDLRSDDLTIILTEGEWALVDELDMASTSDITLDFWNSSYITIARANDLIANLDVISDTGLRSQYEGEGKFVRALTLFNLVRLFGDVPFTTEAVKSTAELPDLTRQPVSLVYTQIETDFADAINLLPAINDVGRATSGAAKGMLAKVHLTKGEIGQAKIYLEDVMNDGYTLEPTVADVFSIDNESNNEILFSIGYKTSSNGEGNVFASTFINNSIGFVPTQEMMDDSPAGSRYDATLAILGVENRNIKYGTDPVNLDADNDWIVLRYADIILMYAEVLNIENGTINMKPAIDELNKVHAREDLAPFVIGDFVNADELADAVKQERRFELAFEAQRWFDLQRYPDGLQILSTHLGVTVPAEDLLLPIPQREIDVTEGVITQNPGY